MARKSRSKKSAAGLAEHRAALREVADALPTVLLFLGEEAHLRLRGLDACRAALRARVPGVEETVFRGAGGDAASLPTTLLGEMQGGSLFATERLLILRDADGVFNAGAGEGKEASPAERLAGRLANLPEGVRLWMECRSLDQRRKVAKTLLGAAVIVPCPAPRNAGEVASWLREAASDEGKLLDSDVPDILMRAHGNELGVLHGELRKLILYAGDAPTIDADDAAAFLSGSMEFDIFKLTNAIEARDMAEALAYARRVLSFGTRGAGGRKSDGENAAHQALHMVAMTVERIFSARALLSAGATPEEMAREAGVSPFRASHLEAAAKRFSIGELRRSLRLLAEAVHASHDTGADASLALERVATLLCRRAKAC